MREKGRGIFPLSLYISLLYTHISAIADKKHIYNNSTIRQQLHLLIN